jgi:ATP-dependent DNA ligase
MHEPKWDGFRSLVFRDEKNVFLQSRTGKSLTSGFPEIVVPFRALSPKRFVLDDHFSDGRFRHGCAFLRVREDKLPKDWLLDRVLQQTVLPDVIASIEARLATAGTNRK